MYVYGPVPSRRLGRSLGVSPIPSKTCSYNCTYCQLGRTTHYQTKRENFYPKEEILAEIIDRASRVKADYITIVGDGEPTLYRYLGWLIRNIKENISLPVAVITNGSLLYRKDVRQDLEQAEVVMSSLDGGRRRTMRGINRPHNSLEYSTILSGQVAFRKEFSGRLWLEIMLIKGVNDSEEELLALRDAVDTIEPDRVYLMTPTRPPAESWVKPPDPATIIKAQEIIGRSVPIVDIECGAFDTGGVTDPKTVLTEIGSRHPLRYEQAFEIEQTLNAEGVIEQMIKDGEFIETNYNGHRYLLPRHFIRDRKK